MKRKAMFALAAVLTVSQLAGTAAPVLADELGEEAFIEMTDLSGETEEIEDLEEVSLPVEEDLMPGIWDEDPYDSADDEMDDLSQTESDTKKNVTDYKLFWSNVNPGSVLNGPYKATKFTVNKGKKLKLNAITLYHYNYGAGKTPGTITLKKGKTKIASWKSTGRYNNQWWDVFPNITLSAGTYTITCSSNGTWSYNSVSKDAGFAEVYGTLKSAGKLGKPVIQSVKYLKTEKGYAYYTFKWSKVNGADGYETQISKKKDFKKIHLKGKGKYTSGTHRRSLGKKDRQKFYVRVRAYKKSGSKYTYGSWSKSQKYTFDLHRKK